MDPAEYLFTDYQEDDDGFILVNQPDKPEVNLEAIIRENLRRIMEVEVCIAVSGESQAGKSTLINALRGIKYGDVDLPEGVEAAPVGRGFECTTDIKEYRWPGNKKVKIFDLPGCNTPNWPLESYAARTDLKSYDMVLIVINNTFKESDRLLAQLLRDAKKPFWFVRSKTDSAVQDYMEDHNQGRPLTEKEEKDLLDNIRRNVHEHFPDMPQLFLVSGRKPYLYDTPALQQQMLEVLLPMKRNELRLRLAALTPAEISAKANILRSRIKWFSLASAAVALIPIPGTSLAVDTTLILSFASNAASSFGLQGDMAKQIYRDNGAFKLITGVLSTKQGLLELLSQGVNWGIVTSMEEVTRYIPFIGQLLASGLSFGSTYYCMGVVLDYLEVWGLDLSNRLIMLRAQEYDDAVRVQDLQDLVDVKAIVQERGLMARRMLPQ